MLAPASHYHHATTLAAPADGWSEALPRPLVEVVLLWMLEEGWRCGAGGGLERPRQLQHHDDDEKRPALSRGGGGGGK